MANKITKDDAKDFLKKNKFKIIMVAGGFALGAYCGHKVGTRTGTNSIGIRMLIDDNSGKIRYGIYSKRLDGKPVFYTPNTLAKIGYALVEIAKNKPETFDAFDDICRRYGADV